MRHEPQRPAENNLGLVSPQEITPTVAYPNYLLIIGWIIIVLGAIFGITMMANAGTRFNRIDKNIILSALIIITSSTITATAYFGLHKILLKIERIEQRLGIMETVKETDTPSYKEYERATEERMQELKTDKNSQEQIPWELQEPTET